MYVSVWKHFVPERKHWSEARMRWRNWRKSVCASGGYSGHFLFCRMIKMRAPAILACDRMASDLKYRERCAMVMR